MLCAQLLADLGGDVIQVEPPGGAPGRKRGPFLGDARDPDLSLSWCAWSRGKRSVTIDIETAKGRERLLRLIESADVLVESEPVDRLEALGLGDDALARINPGLIHASITGFGRSGPKARWVWSDLVIMAAGGPLALTGDADRPPVRVSVPQAFSHAAAEATVGVMVALHHRNRTGEGQRVDVSAQEAVTIATQSNIVAAAIGDIQATRSAGAPRVGDVRMRSIWPAKDGYVAMTQGFGPTFGLATRRLMEFVFEEGFCDAATRDKDWIGYGIMLAEGVEPLEEFERVKRCLEAFTRSKTKAELLQIALERRLLIAPIATIADNVDGPQAAARAFFVTPTGTGRLADVRYPGAFAKFSASPIRPTRRPPHVGEHTAEVLAELEYRRPRPGLPRVGANTRNQDSSARPLAGLNVLDFSWAIAGPYAMRYLADFGATVVRIESTRRIDAARTVRPFIDADPSPENSAIFHNMNLGKKMITLDLTNEASREVVQDLVRWADVVCESFSPGTMKVFGYDYESLKTIRPDIIMLSTSLMGQTGPMAKFAGFGNLAAAIAGFFELTGWPGRPPAGPFSAYTDYIAPRYNAISVLAALEHRRLTGEGQYIDMSQAEAAMHFLAPAVLDYTANSRVQSRQGNTDPNMAPHGVYRAAGDDRWVAIVCVDDRCWRSLCAVVDTLEPHAARFASLAHRLQAREEMDQALSQWTSARSAESIEADLQAAGVPASVVQNSVELMKDPQLLCLGHFAYLPHACGRDGAVEFTATRLSRTPARIGGSLPGFARDKEEVLAGVLGYDAEKIANLLSSGALE
ncbi:MAG: hypothetical protein JWO83_886 [Caulobacteraceae bacterium]|nr:hypothetical protein [Caulobacteraceae bacterium]